MASSLNNLSLSSENKSAHPDSLYHQLFNLTNIVKLVIDPNTLHIVEANPAACAFYGYSQEQFKSLSVTEINAQPESVVQVMFQDVTAGKRSMFETRHRLASGQIRAVSVQAGLLSVESSRYVYAIIQDITEQKRIENALRTSERLYRLFAQNMPDSSVIMFDTDMRYTLVEGPFLKRFGTLYEGMVGKLPHETLATQDAIDFVVPVMQRALHGESFSYEREMPDYTYEAHVAPLLDENRQIIGGMVLSHDITKQKQTADALKTSEERFRSTFDYASIGMALVASDGRWLDVNPALCQIVGYPAKELFQKTFQDLTYPDDLELDLQNVQDLLAGKIDSYQMEKRYFHKQGHVVWVLLSVSLVHDKAGAPLYFISQIQDISERKRLENELSRNEEQLRLVTGNMQDLITQSDSQENIIYTSPSSRLLLGYEPEQMTGHSRREFAHPDDWDKMVSARQKLILEKVKHGVMEGRLRHADGHYVDVETAARFRYDEDLNYIGGVFVTRDITERKRMENLLDEQLKLQTSLEKEQELSSLKSHMMERIAHEFRTPLTTIQVATETLSHYYDRLTPEKRNEKSITVKNQVRHITDMLDEISLVIKGADTLPHLGRVLTDLDILCHEIAAELSTALKMPNKYVIEVQGKSLASIDPKVIHDSLTHIMRNAARYSEPADPVTVRIAQIRDSIEIRIIDCGIGIPADELPRIFEPFFRGSNINERGGLGVGLTIARAAIEAHGGTITVESELGKGTTFIVRLPV